MNMNESNFYDNLFISKSKNCDTRMCHLFLNTQFIKSLLGKMMSDD